MCALCPQKAPMLWIWSRLFSLHKNCPDAAWHTSQSPTAFLCDMLLLPFSRTFSSLYLVIYISHFFLIVPFHFCYSCFSIKSSVIGIHIDCWDRAPDILKDSHARVRTIVIYTYFSEHLWYDRQGVKCFITTSLTLPWLFQICTLSLEYRKRNQHSRSFSNLSETNWETTSVTQILSSFSLCSGNQRSIGGL